MNNEREPRPSVWTVGKVFGMIIGIIGMLGFGICSMCGLVMGIGNAGGLATVLPFVIPGLLLTWFFIWMVRKIFRSLGR